MEHLREWLDAERGRLKGLAKALGIFPSAISQWIEVPVKRVPDVERITGISRHVLRPDFFGPPPESAAGLRGAA